MVSLRPLNGLCDHDKLDAVVLSELAARGGEYPREIADYLENASMMTAPMEATKCRLGCGEFILGGPSLLTDGIWYWRLDAAHYVREHNVALPGDFVSHASKCNFTPPKLSEDNVESLYWGLVKELRGEAK